MNRCTGDLIREETQLGLHNLQTALPKEPRTRIFILCSSPVNLRAMPCF